MEVKIAQTQNNIKPSDENVKQVLYDLILLQFSNLVSDLRIVFPQDIVLKVCQSNLNCLHDNKIDFINYLKKVLLRIKKSYYS